MKNLSLLRTVALIFCVFINTRSGFAQYVSLYPDSYSDQLGYWYGQPSAMTIDSKGNMYEVWSPNPYGPGDGGNYVEKWDGHNWNLIAGGVSTVFSGDGGPAAAAGIGYITGLATDKKGNLYILDNEDLRIRKVDTSGIITTVAGGGVTMGWTDGVPATNTLLNNPVALACDKWGNLYIAQSGDNRIRKVDTNGYIRTIAGTGVYGYSGDGGPATSADLEVGSGLAVDLTGNIYLGGVNCRKITTDGIIHSIAGNGVPGYSGDGGPATNASITAGNVSVDRAGNVYLTTQSVLTYGFGFGYYLGAVRRIDTSGVITTVAGNNYVLYDLPFFDFGLDAYVSLPANQIPLGQGGIIQNDSLGNLYFLDVNLSWYTYKMTFADTAPMPYSGNNTIVSLCKNSLAYNLDGHLAAYNYVGSTVSWSVALSPTHGVLVCSYSMPSTDTLHVPSGITYTPEAGYTGLDMMVVSITNGLATDFDTIHVTVVPPETIVGDSTLCVNGSPVTLSLSDAGGGGSWYTSYYYFAFNSLGPDSAVVSNFYYPITENIIYTNACGTVTKSITVSAAPAITGGSLVCIGDTTSLSATSSGGIWSAKNSNLFVSSSGVLTGSSAGMDTVLYTPTSGCVSDKIVQVGLIDPAPEDSSVCTDTWLYFASGPSETWSIISSGYAVIFHEEFYVTFASFGPDTSGLLVIASNTCGSDTSNIIVNPYPEPIAITGSIPDPWYTDYFILCTGGGYVATDPTIGGIWSMSSGTVSIDSTGNLSVPGSGFGSACVYYTVEGCTSSVNIRTNSSNLEIVCDSVGCPGAPFSVAVIDSSGSEFDYFDWYFYCSNPLMNTTVDNGDNPYEHYYSCPNVTAGVVTFTYSNLCAITSRTVTINPQPAVPDVSPVICAGSTVTATDATTGGTWSSSFDHVSVTSGGVVSTVVGSWDNIVYTLPTGCYNSAPIHISTVSPMPIMGNATFCAGEHLNLVDSTPGGVWSCSDPAIVNSEMVAIAAGTATITYNNGCGVVTKPITVLASPAPIGGHDSLCRTSSATYTDATSGGTWSVTGPGSITSGGVFTPAAVGLVIINYTLPNSCVYSQNVEVDAPSSIVAGLSGDSVFCGMGVHTGLIDSASGGAWTSSNTSVALIEYGGATGIYLYCTYPGLAILNHSVTNACGTFATSKHIAVYPAAGNTYFNNQVCQSASFSVTEADITGTWHNDNGHTSLSSPMGLDGSITGVSGGIDTITYSDINVCGASTVFYITTVDATPHVAPIAGDTTECYGSTVTLTDATPLGIWNLGSSGYLYYGGAFYATSPGLAFITYTIDSLGCSATATKLITVYPPTSLEIDSMHICEGYERTIATVYTGGVWTNLNTHAVIVSSSGTSATVEALTEPRDTVIYEVSSVCGVAEFMHILLIDVYLPSSPITGDSILCAGDSVYLSGEPLSGIWSSSNPLVAGVDGDGVVSGLSSGTSIISFAGSNACSSVVETKSVTVYPASGTVMVDSSRICTGSTLLIADLIGGGVWSSSGSGASFTVGTGSISVVAVSPGIDTLLYTLSGACGSGLFKHIVHIDTPPVADIVSGSSSLCLGATDTLVSSAPAGIWTSSHPAVAATSGSGVVSGVSPGVSVISYTVYGCDTAVAMLPISVYPLSSSSSLDSFYLCPGASRTLSSAAPGGAWSTAFGSAVLVDYGDSVLVSGTAGADTVYYTISTACGTTIYKHLVWFLSLPDAGSISGSLGLCVGSEGLLTSTVGGGIWTESGGAIAMLMGGTVYGASVGTATVNYSVSNLCGSATASAIVTVYSLPSSSIDSQNLCLGATLTLPASPLGGVWTMTNGHAEFVTSGSGSRVVEGLTVGRDTIVYALSGICGTSIFTHIVVIPEAPVLPLITGDSILCTGHSITLADALPGGSWSSSNTAVATVFGGMVTGISPGVSEIEYTVAGCTVLYTDRTVTVAAGGYIVHDSVELCTGTSTTLTGFPSGGTWTVSNSDVASTIVDSEIAITAVTAGRDTIFYAPATGCVAGYNYVIKIKTDTSLAAIVGDSAVCSDATISWSEAVGGGVWVSGNPLVATISSGGIVTAVATGTSIISYSRSEVCGGMHRVTRLLTVDTLPVFVVAGLDTLCAGSTTTYTVAVPGGVWSLSDSLAIGGTEVTGVYSVTAINPGLDSVTYVISNGCGIRISAVPVFIESLPIDGVIVGNDSLCSGQPTTFVESEPGGTWSVAGSHVSVNASGVATYLSSGYDTIEYHIVNYCGAADNSLKVYCMPPTSIAPITGLTWVCVGSTINLSDSTTGGDWSSSGVAASVFSVAGSGQVNGLSPGVQPVYYVTTTYCGNDTASAFVNVVPIPAPVPILGSDTLCVGETVTLSDSASGGTWSLTSGGFISGGVVTCTLPGTDTVAYSYNNICPDLVVVKKEVTVLGLPPAGVITGVSNLCLGSSATYVDSVVGGTWLVGGAGASVTSSGILVGTLAGSDTIFYVVNNYCGADTALKIVAVDTLAHATVWGRNFVCVGGYDTLNVSPLGGLLITTNSNAVVDPGYVVTGVLDGSDSVVYIYSNVCGADSGSMKVTVFTAWGCDSINLVRGVPKGEAAGLSIFPNPGSGIYQVQLSVIGKDIEVRVVDLPGQCVYKAAYRDTDRCEVNISGRASGAYFITVNVDGVVYYGKLILE